MKEQSKKFVANLLLILTTILWGTSFIITKNITEDMPIFLYLGIRFSVAIIAFVPFLINFKRFSKKLIVFAVLTGMLYYFVIVFQTLGIQTTTAGKAAFITGLGTIMDARKREINQLTESLKINQTKED